jgi:hypothetical protein
LSSRYFGVSVMVISFRLKAEATGLK